MDMLPAWHFKHESSIAVGVVVVGGGKFLQIQDARIGDAMRRSPIHSGPCWPARGRRARFGSSGSFTPTPREGRAGDCGCEISPGLIETIPPWRAARGMIKSQGAGTRRDLQSFNRPEHRNVGTRRTFCDRAAAATIGQKARLPGRASSGQRQRPLRSPGLSSRMGLHSRGPEVAFRSGPVRQALPSQARPQIQFLRSAAR